MGQRTVALRYDAFPRTVRSNKPSKSMPIAASRLQRNFFAVGLALFTLVASGIAAAQTPSALLPFKSLSDFETCQRQAASDEDCLIALEKWVNTNPKAAMDAGKSVRLKFNAHVALRYFTVASQHKPKDFCEDSDVQLAVLSGLGLPGRYPDAQRATGIFSTQCFLAHQAMVSKALNAEGGDSYLGKNACAVFAKRQQAVPACQPKQSVESNALTSPVEKLPKIDKNQITLGVVKVYRGPEGEQVSMAPIQGTELFLIRFDGLNSPWAGKAVLHQRTDLGHDTADFWTEQNGHRWTSVARRGGMTIYAPGYKSPDGFSAVYADKLSQDADAKTLLNAYQP